MIQKTEIADKIQEYIGKRNIAYETLGACRKELVMKVLLEQQISNFNNFIDFLYEILKNFD